MYVSHQSHYGCMYLNVMYMCICMDMCVAEVVYMCVPLFPCFSLLLLHILFNPFLYDSYIYAASPVLSAGGYFAMPFFLSRRKFPTSQTMGTLVMYLSIPVQVFACAYAWVCVYKQLTTHTLTTSLISF